MVAIPMFPDLATARRRDTLGVSLYRDGVGAVIADHLKYQTKSFVTQSWYNTSSTSNRFSWRMPHDLMR